MIRRILISVRLEFHNAVGGISTHNRPHPEAARARMRDSVRWPLYSAVGLASDRQRVAASRAPVGAHRRSSECGRWGAHSGAGTSWPEPAANRSCRKNQVASQPFVCSKSMHPASVQTYRWTEGRFRTDPGPSSGWKESGVPWSQCAGFAQKKRQEYGRCPRVSNDTTRIEEIRWLRGSCIALALTSRRFARVYRHKPAPQALISRLKFSSRTGPSQRSLPQ